MSTIYITFPYACCLREESRKLCLNGNSALLNQYENCYNKHDNGSLLYYPVNLDNFTVNPKGQLVLKNKHDDEIGFQIPILYQVDLLILLAHHLNTNHPEILDGYFDGVRALFRLVERKYQAIILAEFLHSNYAQGEYVKDLPIKRLQKNHQDAFPTLYLKDSTPVQREKARDEINRYYDCLIERCYTSLQGIQYEMPYTGRKRIKRLDRCFSMGKELLLGTNRINRKYHSHRCCSVAATYSSKGKPHYYFAISGKDDEDHSIPEAIRKEAALVNRIVRANYGRENVDRVRLNSKVQYMLDDYRRITYEEYLKYSSPTFKGENLRMFSCSERKILSAFLSNTTRAEILSVWSSCFMCVRSAEKYPNVRFRFIEKMADNSRMKEYDTVAKQIAKYATKS